MGPEFGSLVINNPSIRGWVFEVWGLRFKASRFGVWG